MDVFHLFISEIKTYLSSSNIAEIEFRFKQFLEPLSFLPSDFPHLNDIEIHLEEFYSRFCKCFVFKITDFFFLKFYESEFFKIDEINIKEGRRDHIFVDNFLL